MRAKRLWLVVTFPSTTAAMAMESYCRQHEVPGRLIPVPTSISAGCGMCWRAPIEERERIGNAITEAALTGTLLYEVWI
ncbi:MAG: DUF3343 domain-containing protein [bacterium]|nr:DUF3343 domain-containing protein [bacterium]